MIVRDATVEDVPGILPMVRAICAMHATMDPTKYDFLPDIVERYARWLPLRAGDPRSVLLVAVEDEAAAGFLVGSVEQNIPIYRTTEFGFVHDLWVEPDHRGVGVAGMLVERAVEKFQSMGVMQVRLETAAGNGAARALFERHGFRVSAVDMMREL